LALIGCADLPDLGSAVEPPTLVSHLTDPVLLTTEDRNLYPDGFRITTAARVEPPHGYATKGATDAVLWTYDGPDSLYQTLFIIFPDTEAARKAWNNGRLPHKSMYRVRTKTQLEDRSHPAMLLTGNVILPDSTRLGFSDGIGLAGNVIVRTFTQTALTPYSANSTAAVLLMELAVDDLYFDLGLGK